MEAMILDMENASIADIVNEIERLEGFAPTWTLKRHLNARRAISRLPAEILLIAFSLIVKGWISKISYADNVWFEIDPRDIDVPKYTWIPWITHICSRWRDIALQSPTLWRYIIVNRYNYLEMMLRRSQEVPISVYSPTQINDNDITLRRKIGYLLTPHLHRIQSVEIISADPYYELHEATLPGLLPSVQSITVWMLDAPRDDDDMCHAVLFNGWLGENHNSLQHLSLSYPSLAGLQLAARPSLRSLNLNVLQESLDMPYLLRLLKETPVLESLALIDAIPYLPEDDVTELMEPKEIVTLPSLRSLHIRSPVCIVTNFLRHISYPAITSMEVHLWTADAQEIPPDALGRDLGERLPKNLRSISVNNVKSCKELRLFGWTDGEPSLQDRAPYRFIVEYDVFSNPHIACWIFGAMIGRLITEKLEVLHFNIDKMKIVGGDTWDDLYEAINTRAINVHTLRVSSMRHLPHILPPPDDVECGKNEYHSDYRPPTHLPSLKTLWMGRLKEREIERLNSILMKRIEDINMLERLSIPWDDDGLFEGTAELVEFVDVRNDLGV
ncbi:hypothetical protein QCA50_006119 [Cerrena zonata]|uniref:F-box domain-containing protein n=1 Tax=Cerrena zonata TaxID=2478898 RepID=A0AAW0GDT7_9APHY